MSSPMHSQNRHVDEPFSIETADSDVETLRSILFKDERNKIHELQTQLDALQFRLNDTDARAADTSEVLAKASQLSHRSGAEFSDSLKPMVMEQFQNSTRDNPEEMASALFPILGPAIRKMIANMLSRDSKATKRTYKFEQLFLIEKDSGLPICHAKSDTAEAQDADMVSGMLSAIQSFVQDAFSTQEFDGLNTLQLGELSVWIEWGPNAVLAAVIRGVAPERCRTSLQQLLEDVHQDYAQELKQYEGDSTVFDYVKHDLLLFMDNHDSRLRNQVRHLPPKLKRNIAVLALAVVGFIAWSISNYLNEREWSRTVALLDAQPGIVITDSSSSDGQYYIRGMRDTLAADPMPILVKSGIDTENVVLDLEPYRAMHPEFTLERIRSMLVPSPGTLLTLDDSTLIIEGATSQGWIEDAKRLTRQFSEIKNVSFISTSE